MTIKTKAFDASKYIKSPQAEATLWADAVASGHAGVIASALGTIAKARGMTQLAAQTGLSRQALYSGLSDDGNPTLDTVLKVTKALGLGLTAAAPAETRVIGSPDRGIGMVIIEDGLSELGKVAEKRYYLEGSAGLNAVIAGKAAMVEFGFEKRVAGGELKAPAGRRAGAKKQPAHAEGDE
jgi:probable addiction module antidote protein